MSCLLHCVEFSDWQSVVNVPVYFSIFFLWLNWKVLIMLWFTDPVSLVLASQHVSVLSAVVLFSQAWFLSENFHPVPITSWEGMQAKTDICSVADINSNAEYMKCDGCFSFLFELFIRVLRLLSSCSFISAITVKKFSTAFSWSLSIFGPCDICKQQITIQVIVCEIETFRNPTQSFTRKNSLDDKRQFSHRLEPVNVFPRQCRVE